MAKKALIVGVANQKSLAWGIAQSLQQRGYELAFTYLNEKMESRVRPLAESVGAKIIEPLDVNNVEQVTSLFNKLKNEWAGEMDAFIHSIAYAERQDLEGRFVDTSREGFLTALDVSAYSLVALSREVEKLMPKGGSIVTLTYLGSTRVIANYNVMGVAKAALEASVRYLAWDLGASKIRVNAISAGAVKTLSAAGIRDFRNKLKENLEKSPLGENIDAHDVGEMAAFLCADESRHITGTTIFVDSGAHL